MEDRIYHIFIYNDIVHNLWTALSQIYADAHHDFRIFKLYREISRASQEILGLFVTNYFDHPLDYSSRTLSTFDDKPNP